MKRAKEWFKKNGYLLWFSVPLVGWITLSCFVLMLTMPWFFVIPLGCILGFILWLGLGVLNGGTTLIEITIGSSIPLVMVMILIPVFGQAREKAREKACRANLTQLAQAWVEYEADHDDKPLPEENWQAALAPYLPKKSPLKCPDSKGRYRYEAERGGVLFTEREPAHKHRRATIFTDGTIRLLEVDQAPPSLALLARK